MLRFDLSEMDEEEMERVLRREGVDIDAAVEEVRPIVRAVRLNGDASLLEHSRRLDGFAGDSVLVPEEQIDAAIERVPKRLLSSLERCKKRIEAFHSRQGLAGFEYRDSCGTFGQLVKPLDRVGVYAPGGTASYASSVLMAAIPAKLAGVGEIVLCSPARNGRLDDVLLAAARICGIGEIRSVGGPQAIAAMAYGTESIRPVSKIVGPGGVYVSAAKMLVRNDCAIDSLAGPSEVLILADSSADPETMATEMLAQLEHDPMARALLVSSSDALLRRSAEALERLLVGAGRGEIAAAAAETGAVFIKARSVARAMEFSNMYAPEHLLIATRKPSDLLESVENAGSVFLGERSSVSFGDYCSGTNHILPTKGMARSSSSLSVYDFLKVIPYQAISEKGARTLSRAVVEVATAEGLPNHAEAAARAGGVRR